MIKYGGGPLAPAAVDGTPEGIGDPTGIGEPPGGIVGRLTSTNLGGSNFKLAVAKSRSTKIQGSAIKRSIFDSTPNKSKILMRTKIDTIIEPCEKVVKGVYFYI